MEDSERTTKVAQPRPEVVHRVEPGDFTPARPHRGGRLPHRGARRQAEDLHICPSCDSGLVLPTNWAPAQGRRWLVDLRCPDCEWTGSGTYGQRVVDRFDEVLDQGTEAILEDLNTLSRTNMGEFVESFVAAIWADQVLPEDF